MKQYVSYQTGLYTALNLGKCLGMGSFGTVSELLDHNNNPTKLVCKEIEIRSVLSLSKRKVLEMTLHEINALEKMGLLEGYAREEDTFYIVMKKIEGIHPYLSFYYSEETQACYNALRDCHRKDITHFDAHGRNFIFDPNEAKATAIDFGLSNNATFFNIFWDIYTFSMGNGLGLGLFGSILMFFKDLLTYIRHNKLEAVVTFTWWSILIYGALYGVALPILPSQFFYEYLKAKLIHQCFLELRSLALINKFYASYLLQSWLDSLYYNHPWLRGTINRAQTFILNIFKPIYALVAYIPYLQLKTFYGSNFNLIKQLQELVYKASSITQKDAAELLSVPSNTYLQAALLYYPIKESLKVLDDVVVKQIEPQILTKARADLYFQYAPSLYLQAAQSKTSSLLSSLAHYPLKKFR